MVVQVACELIAAADLQQINVAGLGNDDMAVMVTTVVAALDSARRADAGCCRGAATSPDAVLQLVRNKAASVMRDWRKDTGLEVIKVQLNPLAVAHGASASAFGDVLPSQTNPMPPQRRVIFRTMEEKGVDGDPMRV
jgi:hypothetical protein